MRIPSPRANRRARIEIIPLIDIIFFLLATFVMVSLSMIKNQGIALNLPAATTATAQEKDKNTVIAVDEQGKIYFQKQPISLEELRQHFVQIKSRTPETKIYLQGDERADFGKVLTVLDTAREMGLTRIVIQTKKTKN